MAAALGGLLVVVGVSVAVTRGAFVAADQASVAARDGGAEVGPEGATLGPGLATDRGQDAGGGDGAQASRLRGASDQGATLALAPESGSVDAGGAPAQVNGQGASGSEQSASNPSTAGDRVRSREPRQVLFRPNPANVQISVDGAALRAFGPGFRGVMLTPGRHTFRVVGAADCCEEQTVSRDIPGGQEPFELSMRLAYRAARLYVVANVPGDVAITGAGGTVRGRTREILSVPMVGMDDTRRLTVTAEGHQVYTGVARLRAGQLTEHRASLTLSSAALPTPAPSPAPPPAPDPP